jgi:hypothetical protein
MVDGKQVKRVESEPEKAGVGGSIPSLATIVFKGLMISSCAPEKWKTRLNRRCRVHSVVPSPFFCEIAIIPVI